MSSAYLRLLIFLPAILIPACASSSLAFLMMYFAYKLHKQGDSIQPWHTPFPIWNKSVGPCPVLTVASWPAYRFLKRQVRWSGIPISFRIVHSLLWSTVKGFGIVNKAEIDIFLKLILNTRQSAHFCFYNTQSASLALARCPHTHPKCFLGFLGSVSEVFCCFLTLAYFSDILYCCQ